MSDFVGLNGIERNASYIGFHLPIPFLASQFDERLIENAAGVVQEHIQFAEVLHGQRDGLLGNLVLGYVGDQRHESRPTRFSTCGLMPPAMILAPRE